MVVAHTICCRNDATPIVNDQELPMTLAEFQPTESQTPSRSRMRYVEAQLRSEAEAVLREVAYVLKLTQQVKDEILCEATEEDALAV
jgi:hypothetical protein